MVWNAGNHERFHFQLISYHDVLLQPYPLLEHWCTSETPVSGIQGRKGYGGKDFIGTTMILNVKPHAKQ